MQELILSFLVNFELPKEFTLNSVKDLDERMRF
jgi:hypothetical protein